MSQLTEVHPSMDEEQSESQEQNLSHVPPVEPDCPQPDWSESEWFQRWLKLARREKE